MTPAKPARKELRRRWPPGLFGWLAYLTDHCIYGFDWPVDWPQSAADEVSVSDDPGWPSPGLDPTNQDAGRQRSPAE